MCGRFVAFTPADELSRIFSAGIGHDFEPTGVTYNVAPTNRVAVVVETAADGHAERSIESMRWGLIPSWAKDRSIGSKMFNARSETVAVKPSFRVAFRKRRAIIPADGFYEWTKSDNGKVPYYITRADKSGLAFAGLWENWSDKEDGEYLRSFTIITTTPNEEMAQLHDRMPVILAPENWDEWLDPGVDDAEHLQRLLIPAANGTLEYFAVSSAVGNVKNKGPELIEPV